jgi:hypothetical protein
LRNAAKNYENAKNSARKEREKMKKEREKLFADKRQLEKDEREFSRRRKEEKKKLRGKWKVFISLLLVLCVSLCGRSWKRWRNTRGGSSWVSV